MGLSGCNISSYLVANLGFLLTCGWWWRPKSSSGLILLFFDATVAKFWGSHSLPHVGSGDATPGKADIGEEVGEEQAGEDDGIFRVFTKLFFAGLLLLLLSDRN